MALADRRVLFPGRSRGGQLFPRDADGSLRRAPGSTSGPPRLPRRVPPRRPLWARADRRSRAAGALLAHAHPIGNAPSHDQDLLSDVARRVGAAVLRRGRLALVRPGARPAWLARLATRSPAQSAGVRGPARDGRRRASRLLRGGLYGRAPFRHEPSDLGGHDASRTRLPDLGGVDVGGPLDPARFLGWRVRRQHRRTGALRFVHPRPRGGRDHRTAGLARKDRDGVAERLGPPARRDGAGRNRASSIYAATGPGPTAGDRAGARPSRRADPPCGDHLLLGPAVMMRYWRSMLVLLITGIALGCTSPESTRTRGGCARPRAGNLPRGAVQLHTRDQS